MAQFSEDDKERLRLICEQWLLPHATVVLVLPRPDAKPTEVKCGGTGCLLGTAEAPLLVTNAHVYRAFEDQKKCAPNAALMIGGNEQGVPISDPEVVDLDDQLDLAAIKLPSSVLLPPLGKCCLPIETSEPVVGTEDACMAVGFPGTWRKPDDQGNVLDVGLMPVCFPVVSSTDNVFTLSVSDATMLVQAEYTPGLDLEDCLGGMSGSGVFVVRGQELRLAGFVFEGAELMGSPILRCVAANVLRPDGTIDRAKLPQ